MGAKVGGGWFWARSLVVVFQPSSTSDSGVGTLSGIAVSALQEAYGPLDTVPLPGESLAYRAVGQARI